MPSVGRAVGVRVRKAKSVGGGVCVSRRSGVDAVSGVEAWSVANRSGVGVEAAGMLHPATAGRSRIAAVLQNLFAVRLDGFNMELLTA